VKECGAEFTYNLARQKHEKEKHPTVKFPKRANQWSKPKSKPKVHQSPVEVVNVEYCCFCGKHLPNAFVKGVSR
jgi:hypothetical protein